MNKDEYTSEYFAEVQYSQRADNDRTSVRWVAVWSNWWVLQYGGRCVRVLSLGLHASLSAVDTYQQHGSVVRFLRRHEVLIERPYLRRTVDNSRSEGRWVAGDRPFDSYWHRPGAPHSPSPPHWDQPRAQVAPAPIHDRAKIFSSIFGTNIISRAKMNRRLGRWLTTRGVLLRKHATRFVGCRQ